MISATSEVSLFGVLFLSTRINLNLRSSGWIERSTTTMDLWSFTGAKRTLMMLDFQEKLELFGSKRLCLITPKTTGYPIV